MSVIRLAILGAGSVRCTTDVIASLATYFGERPLEIRMFDADLERLDLFDRFARLCFAMTHNEHGLISTVDAAEATHDSDRVVLQVGENCASKYLRERHRMGIANLGEEAMIEQAIEEMLGAVPADAEILSLQHAPIGVPRDHYRVDWLDQEPTWQERLAVPHQVLRWIRGEEYAHALLRANERSPLNRWLNDLNAAEIVRAHHTPRGL